MIKRNPFFLKKNEDKRQELIDLNKNGLDISFYPQDDIFILGVPEKTL